MATLTLEQQVRKRVWNYFTYETARSVGLSIPDLQQFALGLIKLEPESLNILARRMDVLKYPVH